ncbi:MAG TPA: hypothetical protein VM869_08110 [Enhygromyxa sp.]|nr:hypothetical protein [Enhygromyxa sp.]
MDRLAYRFPDSFTFREVRESPEVEADEPGVGLALGRMACGPDSVALMLHATVGLDGELFYAFKLASRAIVVTVEELGSGRAAAFRMIDPSLDFLRPMSPNFEGDSGERGGVFVRGWVNAPVELHVVPTPGHPGLWFQAHLREFHSQRVHLSLPSA